MDWYQNFIFKTLMKLPGVVDVQSTVTMTEMKYTTAIPVRGTRAL
jgi:Lrp/AsnC family transcriptional regulator